MIFDLNWIPDFSYFEYKIKSPINIEKALFFIKEKIASKEIFKSNEELFWTLALLYQIDELNLVDEKLVKNYILNLKHQGGGYRFSDKTDYPDTSSTFYCVASLKMLGLDDLIEDKDIRFIISSQNSGDGADGGFLHCHSPTCNINCEGKSLIKSSFLALSLIILLDRLNLMDKEKFKKYIIKNTFDDIRLIYNLLNLKHLNYLDKINLEKKIPIILSWQIINSGFGIKSEVPSIEHIFWICICLEKLGKLDLINFEGVLNFIKNMQNKNGGFTDQYKSIKSNEPNLKSTVLALFSVNLLWKRLSLSIENEILLKAKSSSEIDLVPIRDKFSIPIEFILEIAEWLLTSKWIEGKILNRLNNFQGYLNQQNTQTQEILNKLLEAIDLNEGKKKLNLTEFSKNFEFSNAVERIKLVVNDLIINNFLFGNLITKKKDIILEVPLVLNEYISLKIPFNSYYIIVKEKKKVQKAKNQLIKLLLSNLIDFLKNSSKEIDLLTDQEKIPEAKRRLNEYYEFSNNQIRKFEDLISNINTKHKFIKSNLLNNKFKRFWPNIKHGIELSYSTFKSEKETRIKEKEEYIKNRREYTKNQNAIEEIKFLKNDANKNLDLYLYELYNFFPSNFSNYAKISSLKGQILHYLEVSSSKIDQKILDLSTTIKFLDLKKELKSLINSWSSRKEEIKGTLEKYQNILDKREELKKYISESTSILQIFIKENSKQISELIKENNLIESSTLLKESNDKFNEVLSNQNEIFYITLDQLNKEIPDFRKYTIDTKLEWIQKREIKEKKWKTITKNLASKLHFGAEFDRKNELQQLIMDKTKDIISLIENMKDLILKLIESKNFNDAENKVNNFYAKVNEEIKISNQEFKEFIKTSTVEFKSFRNTTKDLVEKWETKRIHLINLLNEIKNELENEIEKASSEEKKIDLYFLIKTHKSDIKNKISKLKLKFNMIIDSKKRLSELDEELESDIISLKNGLRSYDNQINSFIKTSSRIYDTFNEITREELDLWNDYKANFKKKIDYVSEKIRDDIFIEKVQFFAKAFKEKEIDISYLSKVLKIKLEPLKLKLITLISNLKLYGKLDSRANKFILEEEQIPEKFLLDEIQLIEGEGFKDPIKDDILKLRYLIIIHTNGGGSVYNRKLGDWRMDSDLIGGFITAVQDFSSEIKNKRIPIKSVQYHDFEILLEQGKYAIAALFIDGKETNWLRKKTLLFVEEFEKKNRQELKNWRGELGSFRNSGYLIDKVFEIYRVQGI